MYRVYFVFIVSVKYLIVGLGNIGMEYCGTRVTIFVFLDAWNALAETGGLHCKMMLWASDEGQKMQSLCC